jgi:hypothetical protein
VPEVLQHPTAPLAPCFAHATFTARYEGGDLNHHDCCCGICLCPCSCPYLAAACQQVLRDNGFPAASFSVINTRSPPTLKLGSNPATDVSNICNILVADVLDDGVLSGGLIPCVSNALEELLVTDQPVIVPQRLTVMAQAVGVRPSVVGMRVGNDCGGCGSNGSSSRGGSCGGVSDRGCSSTWGCQEITKLDLSAMDAHRLVQIQERACTPHNGPWKGTGGFMHSTVVHACGLSSRCSLIQTGAQPHHVSVWACTTLRRVHLLTVASW